MVIAIKKSLCQFSNKSLLLRKPIQIYQILAELAHRL